MADAVQDGAIVNPKRDEDEIIAEADGGSDNDPLGGGGGDDEDIDRVRAATGAGNDNFGVQELNTAEDLTKDARED